MVARGPQREREVVVAPEPLGQAAQLIDRDTEGVAGLDAVARHARPRLLAAERRELGEDRLRPGGRVAAVRGRRGHDRQGSCGTRSSAFFAA